VPGCWDMGHTPMTLTPLLGLAFFAHGDDLEDPPFFELDENQPISGELETAPTHSSPAGRSARPCDQAWEQQ
jgi:hypothetical protein